MSTEINTEWKCEDCNCKTGISKTLCPFAQDVYNEEVEVILCEDCYHERCMDI